MANSVTLRKLSEGPRHLVVKADFIIDTTAEITDSVFVDPRGSGTCDPVPILQAGATLTVEEIWASLQGMSVLLEFDGTGDQPIYLLSDSCAGEIDFRSFGGIKDTSSTPTGKILLTTAGATAALDGGTIILKLRKS